MKSVWIPYPSVNSASKPTLGTAIDFLRVSRSRKASRTKAVSNVMRRSSREDIVSIRGGAGECSMV